MQKDSNQNRLSEENEKLKSALRWVYDQQKALESSQEKLKAENEKLNHSVRQQVTIIPELQIKNKVLKEQLRVITQDLHQSEKSQDNTIEKLNQLKLAFKQIKRKLFLSQSFLFITFIGATALIWQSYRENESNKIIKNKFAKLTYENETLAAQNKMYFNEKETFQTTIQNQYKEQINLLDSKLALISYERNELQTKYTKAIESFKEQTATLKQEYESLQNLTKNEFEEKLAALRHEKSTINNKLMESETKNREIVLIEPKIQEQKLNQFLKTIDNENNHKTNESNHKKPTHSDNFNNLPNTKNPYPNEDILNILEQNERVPFKLSSTPF